MCDLNSQTREKESFALLTELARHPWSNVFKIMKEKVANLEFYTQWNYIYKKSSVI